MPIAVERSRYTMGTTASVRIEALAAENISAERAAAMEPADEGRIALAARLAEAALDRIDEVDRAASLYRPDSDLVSLNAAAFPGPAPVAPLLADLIGASLGLARATRGAFDPTVKPLMDQLGFYREIGSKPDPRGLAGALARVGYRRIAYDESARTVRFGREGMAIDLGGIGKGYALDRAGTFLESHGVARAQLELSRAFLFLGKDPARADGRFALGVAAVPGTGGVESLAAVVFVPEGGVATSSPLGQTRPFDGRQVGHIVDPRRGPLPATVLSATVWAPSAAQADALATALVVMGPDGMRRLSHRLRFEALLLLAKEPREAQAPAGGVGVGAPPGQISPLLAVATPGMLWSRSPAE